MPCGNGMIDGSARASRTSAGAGPRAELRCRLGSPCRRLGVGFSIACIESHRINPESPRACEVGAVLLVEVGELLSAGLLGLGIRDDGVDHLSDEQGAHASIVLINTELASSLDKKLFFDQTVQDVCSLGGSDCIAGVSGKQADSLFEGFTFDRDAIDRGGDAAFQPGVEFGSLAQNAQTGEEQAQSCSNDQENRGAIRCIIRHRMHGI